MSDVVRQFVSPGNYALTSDMVYFATRAPGKSFVDVNWKPASKWADADGGNAAINADIDKMAESVKSVAPNKIFLSIHHEPQNDVSGGAAGCSSSIYKGSAGTPAQYVSMWHNVRARFNAKGVTNVVWVWNIQGESKWTCMLDAMYPGDKYVDWIGWDTYGFSASTEWPQHSSIVYNFLSSNSNSTHDYKSHPWGIFEDNNSGDPAIAHQEYANMKTTLDNNSMPLLKLYSIWDNNANGTDYRIDYDHQTSAFDSGGQPAFNNFGNDAKFE